METVTHVFGVKPPKVFTPTNHKPVECANPELVVGLELEVENCPKGLTHYMVQAGEGWSIEPDGSLRPQGESWEFITKPTQLGYVLPMLKEFFSKMKFNDANYSDRCSVHVHTNVTDFTQEQLATLAVVYTVVEDVLFKFVNHYKVDDHYGKSRDTNIYCIPWTQCRLNYQLVDNIFHDPGRAFHRWQKYTALNLLPITAQGTVEWRHLHGTADMEKITLWLNLIGAIMQFCKQNSFEDVVKTIKILNDTSAYQQFFNSVLQEYLPYDETYRGPMAEGVVNAKYSMINWEPNKGKVKPKPYKKSAFEFDGINHDENEEEEVHPRAERQPAPAPFGHFVRPDAQQAEVLTRLWGEADAARIQLAPAAAPLHRRAQIETRAERDRRERVAWEQRRHDAQQRRAVQAAMAAQAVPPAAPDFWLDEVENGRIA